MKAGRKKGYVHPLADKEKIRLSMIRYRRKFFLQSLEVPA